MGSRVDRVARLIGLIGVVGFLVTAFTPLAHRLNLATAVPAELVPSDAIVVLGAWVSPSGTLSSESLRRTNHGIALYRRGLAPTLVLLAAPPRAARPKRTRAPSRRGCTGCRRRRS